MSEGIFQRLRKAVARNSAIFLATASGSEIKFLKKLFTVEEAELYLNKALFINSELGILFATKGLMYQLKGDLDAAEKNYNEALALDDGLQGVQLNLGDILYQKNKITDAMVYWQRALELSALPELAQRRLKYGCTCSM